MTLTLHQLHAAPKRKRIRVGRGSGSGRGTYSTLGMKGQKARSGGRHKGGHGGKKVPSYVFRLPKKAGFRSRRPDVSVVNVGALQTFAPDAVVRPQDLVKKGLIADARSGVKILGGGKLGKKLTIHAHEFSKSAERAITKVGGEIVRIVMPRVSKSAQTKKK